MAYSGYDSCGKLVAGSGAFGTYEAYDAGRMTFTIMASGKNATNAISDMNSTISDVNGFNQGYNFKINNCHCVSTAFLTNVGGISIPGSITTSASLTMGINQGWGKMPDGY